MSQFPMKSKYGLVLLEQVGGRSPRRWRVSFVSGSSPVLFGTIGRLTYVEHKDEKLRNKARHEITRRWADHLRSPYYHASCDRFILQGESIDIQTNLNEFEDMYYDALLPTEHRIKRIKDKLKIMYDDFEEHWKRGNFEEEWNEPVSKYGCKVHVSQLK